MAISRKVPAIGRRSVLAATAGILSAPSIVRAQGQNGVALVIGNSKYLWEAQLPNVRRDAPDVARRFQALGLKTELLQDAGRDAMLAALERLRSAAASANLATFYFAGHGVSWRKQSYVVPVDASLNNDKALGGLITVPAIDSALMPAANRLLVFDSCRNNPSDGWLQREARALAAVEAADSVAAAMSKQNALTLYSTASGAVALDGPPGANSPFAAAFLRQLDVPSIDLQALPAKLRRDLLLATEGRQLVWDVNTFKAPFVLAGAGKGAAGSVPAVDPSRILELPNAYAMVQKLGLPLPPGLVAIRPATDTPLARVVGSYRYDPLVTFVSGTSGYPMPSVFLVLAVSESGQADLIFSGRDFVTGGNGKRWTYKTAPFTGNVLSYLMADDLTKVTFEWRDRNSGVQSSIWTSRNGNSGITRPIPFNRLDG